MCQVPQVSSIVFCVDEIHDSFAIMARMKSEEKNAAKIVTSLACHYDTTCHLTKPLLRSSKHINTITAIRTKICTHFADYQFEHNNLEQAEIFNIG